MSNDGWFEPASNDWSERQRRLYAAYEIAHTAVDFNAALAFLVGSILFFWDATQYAGTWMFVVGSVLFAAKPTLRLAREIHHVAVGREEAVAMKKV